MKDRVRTQSHLWGIVLAGGEGRRMSDLTQRWMGYRCPKQYCAFDGDQTMLECTLSRVRRVISADRILTVVNQSHGCYLDRLPEGQIAGKLLGEPASRGTGPGVFLPLTYILAADPEAHVVIFPCDHYVSPESAFSEEVQRAVAVAEQFEERLVLLAAQADRPETEYGWIEAGEPLHDYEAAARGVVGFHEKPTLAQAFDLYERGGLWNTMIVAAKGRTLWRLGHEFLPRIVQRFETLLARLTSEGLRPEIERLSLLDAYRGMASADFSRHLLQRAAASMAVVAMKNTRWNDWGNPGRVAADLKGLAHTPEPLAELLSLA